MHLMGLQLAISLIYNYKQTLNAVNSNQRENHIGGRPQSPPATGDRRPGKWAQEPGNELRLRVQGQGVRLARTCTSHESYVYSVATHQASASLGPRGKSSYSAAPSLPLIWAPHLLTHASTAP